MLRSSLCTVAFVLAVFVAGIAKTDTVTDWARQKPVEAVPLTEQERICFEMINALRERAGLSPFVLCPDLIDQSRRWSTNLRSRGYLYHGANQEICAQTNTECGERAFNLWNNSPPHRAFLYRSGTTVGIGNDGNFWTMRGESVVRERSSDSPSVGRFYYVPSGESLSDLSSIEGRDADHNADPVEQTATNREQYTHVNGFYYVPAGTCPSVLSSAEWVDTSTVERTATSSISYPYRAGFFRRVSVFR